MSKTSHQRKPSGRPNALDMLHKSAGQLFEYSYVVLEKFDKKERFGLAADIKVRVNDILDRSNEIRSYHKRDQREMLCRELDIKCKTLIDIIYVCYLHCQINEHKYEVWSRRADAVSNYAVGIAMKLAGETTDSSSAV